MNGRIPEENVWWIFMVEESDSEDLDDGHISDSESADSDSEENK